MRPADDQPTASHRLTVQEAASRLGVTVDAVRGRIKRGTLSSHKDEDGTVFVFLSNGDQPPDQSNDQPRPGADQPELVEVLQEQNDYLRRQLEVWQEEARRKDHIIAALTERIPELPAPAASSQEATGAPETASERQGRGDAPTGAEHPVERPSWWRKFFGLE
jgi:excisionase family DNA binding protein